MRYMSINFAIVLLDFLLFGACVGDYRPKQSKQTAYDLVVQTGCLFVATLSIRQFLEFELASGIMWLWI